MNVLMVVSSVATMGPGGAPTGGWLEELAAAYWVFRDAGCEVALASPQGGAAPLDPMSLGPDWLTANGERFQVDPAASAALASTLRLDAVDPAAFDAAYLVGGVATAWDFPGNADLNRIVSVLYAQGKPVAGVCHGVLGLTGAKDADQRFIVAGRNVTGISNAEEVLTGFDKIVPVLPETLLRGLGAIYRCAAPFAECVVVDGKLMTGQNPASAGPLASAVLDSAGQDPAGRSPAKP
jgi:putative intracellular protease/amidase